MHRSSSVGEPEPDTTRRGGVWTVVVAAGSGRRFGGDKLDELLVPPAETVLARSIAVASEVSAGVVVVRPAGRIVDHDVSGVRWVEGGSTRSASVRNGLAAVPAEATVVLVHDAARPLADGDLYRRVIAAVEDGADCAVPVVAVVDTIRSVDGAVVDRDMLRAVQTPQGFGAAVLRAAHAGGGDATDDAALVERAGGRVVSVDGDVRNLKITTPVDLVVARALAVRG
jgi:2-C-methyl-D-erythritol 4-phosphate cytidylyltransferase